ncbi:hypothetical protein C4D60_Mb09t09450 [Musa balbisiana]|uniref:Uncharacterized protein n=1 Tax=Musa balbisiana TaxID=52838 RepID=A0A4S8IF60_MUSBA|nr:hypothetical protein C4D60_Mb09t09450 [Musa balbisiana]
MTLHRRVRTRNTTGGRSPPRDKSSSTEKENDVPASSLTPTPRARERVSSTRPVPLLFLLPVAKLHRS